MSVFTSGIGFHGTWRPYQQRILDDAEQLSTDRKVHIVAAPGSGKTTLGLALIVRQDAAALVLAPTTTIQEQWVQRFAESFLPDESDASSWISTSLKHLKPLTVITYQALHAAVSDTSQTQNPDNSAMQVSESESDVTSDDSDLDDMPDDSAQKTTQHKSINPEKVASLASSLAQHGVSTLCFDEAHHLKTEWWKALTQVKAQMGSAIATISLTATPPYDSSDAEWKRYIELCGEIDAEIFTPGLVADTTLCPHQDYVYFNFPSEDETHQILDFEASAQNIYSQLMNDAAFIQAVSLHIGLADPLNHGDIFLEDTRYLIALLSFLQSHDIKASAQVRKITGRTKGSLPLFDVGGLEILLQGFLSSDTDSYPGAQALQQRIRELLLRTGHLEKKRVTLVDNPNLYKSLTTSKGKLNSIVDIAVAESIGLESRLRMVVLTDYIRKDSLEQIGNPLASFTQIGVVPIFELVRRALPLTPLGALSGSLVIVPNSAVARLEELMQQSGSTITLTPLDDTSYSRVSFSASMQRNLVDSMTQLFEEGLITILVGTKSLLGEGWDSPCINSLILASFVGSTVSSNQMRGRAIRSLASDPTKTANIWHLVCMDPRPRNKTLGWAQSAIESLGSQSARPNSHDFETLERRFSHFVGVNYEGTSIENGIHRLSAIHPPYTPEGVRTIDQQMLTLAQDREKLRDSWARALQQYSPTSLAPSEALQSGPSNSPRSFLYINFGLYVIGLIIATIIGIVPFFTIWSHSAPGSLVHLLQSAWIQGVGILCVPPLTLMVVDTLMMFSPQRLMGRISAQLFKTLQETGAISKSSGGPCINALEPGSYMYSDPLLSPPPGFSETWLPTGSLREKNIYADAMAELLGPVVNPRYLITQRFGRINYMAVPSVLGQHKEDAQLLSHHLRGTIGVNKIVYTRTPEGREILLKARTKAYVNRNQFYMHRQRKLEKAFSKGN